jgi:predicted NAD/FAD-dependent oxidoreductase
MSLSGWSCRLLVIGYRMALHAPEQNWSTIDGSNIACNKGDTRCDVHVKSLVLEYVRKFVVLKLRLEAAT